jgi:DNA-binding HxlR family transcriptional regulator
MTAATEGRTASPEGRTAAPVGRTAAPGGRTAAPGGRTAASGPRTCSIARTLDVVGEKWALLAVREVFLGNRRFDEMVRRTGAPRDTLAARLRTLTGAGILERRQYCEHPARYEYRLTEAGRDLYPVIVSLMRWGDTHLAGQDGPPLTLEHRCGHRMVPQLVCESCGEPVDPRDTRPLAAGA